MQLMKIYLLPHNLSFFSLRFDLHNLIYSYQQMTRTKAKFVITCGGDCFLSSMAAVWSYNLTGYSNMKLQWQEHESSRFLYHEWLS